MKTYSLDPQTRVPHRGSAWPALLGLALLAATATPSSAQGNWGNPAVLPPASHPFGATYAEWAARYWQWAHSLPSTATPANGTASLSAGQSAPVWFLPGVSGNATITRDVTVPVGVALFTPALSVYVNNADCPANTTFSKDELLAQANGAWDFAASLTVVVIDGVPVAGLENPQTTAYRVESDLFYVTVADHDNILAATGVPCFPDGGTIDYVTVGAFVMIKPLSAGHHTIRVVGGAGPLDDPFFVKDITYNITVTH